MPTLEFLSLLGCFCQPMMNQIDLLVPVSSLLLCEGEEKTHNEV